MGKWIFEKIKYVYNCLLDIIFPRVEFCTGCGRELKEFNKYRLCPSCYSKISYYDINREEKLKNNENINRDYENLIIACYYEGLVRELVHKLKYKDRREIAVTIAAILSDCIDEKYLSYDYIIPVPISKSKLKKRGYNHTELIGAELSNILNIPLLKGLERYKDTKPQVLFNILERWYNVKDCFKCICTTEGKKILLLDDIITSGATAHFCAKEIRSTGANSITVISFAKSNLQ
jgi:competence protein ComFC